MILTVTLNPLLERRFIFNNLDIGNENRGGTVQLKAGGKGINVSRQLKKLHVNNIALSFAGGANGKIFREILRNEDLSFTYVNTKDNTREAALILETSTGKLSTYFGTNSDISNKESAEFINKMEKMIANCEIVVFAGSSPNSNTDSIIPAGIEIANKMEKISICDTYGNHIKSCIDASPTIIHNNLSEIQVSLNRSLSSENEILDYLDSLYSKGIKQAFVTAGDKPYYSSNFDFHYKVTVPKIQVADATGSGDAFVAGVAYGWHNKIALEQQLRLASALGVCNAQSFDTCSVDLKDVESNVKDISIQPVGKKIKIIDDKAD